MKYLFFLFHLWCLCFDRSIGTTSSRTWQAAKEASDNGVLLNSSSRTFQQNNRLHTNGSSHIVRGWNATRKETAKQVSEQCTNNFSTHVKLELGKNSLSGANFMWRFPAFWVVIVAAAIFSHSIGYARGFAHSEKRCRNELEIARCLQKEGPSNFVRKDKPRSVDENTEIINGLSIGNVFIQPMTSNVACATTCARTNADVEDHACLDLGIPNDLAAIGGEGCSASVVLAVAEPCASPCPKESPSRPMSELDFELIEKGEASISSRSSQSGIREHSVKSESTAINLPEVLSDSKNLNAVSRTPILSNSPSELANSLLSAIQQPDLKPSTLLKMLGNTDSSKLQSQGRESCGHADSAPESPRCSGISDSNTFQLHTPTIMPETRPTASPEALENEESASQAPAELHSCSTHRQQLHEPPHSTRELSVAEPSGRPEEGHYTDLQLLCHLLGCSRQKLPLFTVHCIAESHYLMAMDKRFLNSFSMALIRQASSAAVGGMTHALQPFTTCAHSLADRAVGSLSTLAISLDSFVKLVTFQSTRDERYAFASRCASYGLLVMTLATVPSIIFTHRLTFLNLYCQPATSPAMTHHPTSYLSFINPSTAASAFYNMIEPQLICLGWNVFLVSFLLLLSWSVYQLRGALRAFYSMATPASWPVDVGVGLGVSGTLVGGAAVALIGAAWVTWVALWLLWVGTLAWTYSVRGRGSWGSKVCQGLLLSIVLPLACGYLPFSRVGLQAQDAVLDVLRVSTHLSELLQRAVAALQLA